MFISEVESEGLVPFAGGGTLGVERGIPESGGGTLAERDLVAAARYVLTPQISPGKLLSRELERVGMSQADLARRMGMSETTISRMVRDHQKISAERAAELEEILNVPAVLFVLKQACFDLSTADRRAARVRNSDQTMRTAASAASARAPTISAPVLTSAASAAAAAASSVI